MSDKDDEELQNALAAFGEDAMALLDDEDELSLEQLADIEEDASPVVPATNIADSEHDSPMMRYVKTINRKIYGSQPAQPDASKSQNQRFVLFCVGEQNFALPMDHVLEIARYPKVTELPRTPAWLRGVTNLRGQVVSVTDLRQLLNLSPSRPVVSEKILVVRNQEQCTAIVADRVVGIKHSKEQPETLDSKLSSQIADVAQGAKRFDQVTAVVIDPEKLFKTAVAVPDTQNS